jgi:pilus assembly protein CpaE
LSTETAILLPSAKVHFFLKDRATYEAANRLQGDWRFARVAVQVHDGGVEDAIRFYAQNPSPEILFIETDSTGQDFVGRLDALSQNCQANTSAVVIGPVNDVNLYRSLTAMGVSDYLVIPVPEETLAEVIATSLIEKLGASGSRLIALAGSKGGVGVSALAQAMAWISAETLGQKTLLLDGAGAWSSLPVGMGYEPAGSTSEAIRAVVAKDTDSFRRLIFNAHEKLSVLATGTESMLETSPQIGQFEEILNTTMASYPVVIADLSGSVPSLQKTVLSRAHETIVVATPTLSSLRQARGVMQEIKKLHGGGASIDLVLNMGGFAPGKEVTKSDIKAAMDCDPAAVIPFDPKLFVGAENEGKKISSEKAGQEVCEKLLPLVRKVVSREAASTATAEQGGLGGLLSKLKPKK